ncbi:4591_t:CDS:2 [Cetraspora pellucida]|uniref:4591_t:CDS:1 n=1 Tax=Cetraspora pellucida TaxID=1433469 RepID=A0ACA9NG53_9GLOM|nr:4591_t:CDS:2 [Cetraspora pellucida]
MSDEINEELTNYLSTILDELCIEKNQETNIINELVHQQICPKCKNKLPMFAEIVDEQSKIINATEKLPISPYIFKQRSILERYSESEANGSCTCPNGELTLSEQMIRFSEIASTKRNEFIKATLIKKTPLGIWHPIPITCDEAELQKSEGSLKKSEILSIIISLISSLGDLDRPRFRGLSNKSHEELVNILQEVKNILAENNISVSEE